MPPFRFDGSKDTPYPWGTVRPGDIAYFAGRARKHLTRPHTVRWVQRGTGVVMAGAAVAVATR